MTDSVARAEAEKQLEEAVGMDYTAGKLCVNTPDERRCHIDRFGDWRKLWNAALSLMEENERLKRERDTLKQSLEDYWMPTAKNEERLKLHWKERFEAKLAGEKWVSVETKLPDDERDVLVLCKGQPIWIGWKKQGGGWRVRGCSADWSESLTVTHWRHLPLPPTEGKASQEQNGEREP